MTSSDPVVDSCVIVDMFDPQSPRHKIAKRLGDILIQRKQKAYMPWTGMFEINRAIQRIRTTKSAGQLSKYFDENRPIFVRFIPVDRAFTDKYFLPDLPYTKASDMLFLSLAYVDKRPLITEDGKLMAAGREAGIAVFSIGEYLAELRSP